MGTAIFRREIDRRTESRESVEPRDRFRPLGEISKMLGREVEEVSDSASLGESISELWDWKLLSEGERASRLNVRRAVTRATAFRCFMGDDSGLSSNVVCMNLGSMEETSCPASKEESTLQATQQ